MAQPGTCRAHKARCRKLRRTGTTGYARSTRKVQHKAARARLTARNQLRNPVSVKGYPGSKVKRSNLWFESPGRGVIFFEKDIKLLP